MAKTMDILHIELDGKVSTKTVSEGDEDYLITSEEECYRLISEVKASNIRYTRNKLLAESDWTQNSDVPETTRAKWQSYRQALRDITTHEKFPDTFDRETDFPTKPS
tara:strand:+ start:89 stop:409 length:321 start_codon:yes stop_codon:yes gene_type:complete